MENEVVPPVRYFDSPQRAEDRIVLQGQTLNYSITAEFIPICDDNAAEQARSFCVSYELTGADAFRPVTFAFNGKPGTSTLYLHMACLAPKTYSLEGMGVGSPRRPFKVSDNTATLLDVSDLVFIDPIGTGFSTVTNHERERQFYGVRQDVDAMARIIRGWLVRHGRHAAPFFVLGESYGGLRGSGLVLRLQQMHMMPAGLIALSPALSYGELHTSMLYEHHLVHTVPAMTAAAWFHRKLDADLLARSMEDVRAEAARWAQTDYLTFLWKGSEASEDERRKILKGLGRYTALPPEVLEAHHLRINDKQFAGLLLADEGRVTSYFDSRLTHPGRSFDATTDAQTYNMSAACYTAFYEYFGRMMKLPENPDYLALSGRRTMSTEHHQEFVRKYDLQILNAVKNDTWFNVLHMHGAEVRIDEVQDYPVQGLSWHDRDDGPSMDEVRKYSTKAFVGGLSWGENWLTKTEAQVVAEVREMCGRPGVIVGPGCVIEPHTPEKYLELVHKTVLESAKSCRK